MTVLAPPIPLRGAPGTMNGWHAAPGARGLGAYRAPTGNFYSPTPQGRPLWYPVFPQAATPALVPGTDDGVYLNPAKDAEHWFWLSAQGPGSTFPVVVPGMSSVTVAFIPPAEESTQGDFEIVGLQGTWSPLTARFSINFNSIGLDRLLTPNGPVENNLIFGTGALPGILFESFMVQASTALIGTITNLGAAPITVALVAKGRRFMEFDEQIQARRRERFNQRRTCVCWLVPDQGAVVPLGAGLSVNLTYSVPSDADFECWTSLDDSDGPYSAQFFEGLSSRAMSDVAMDAQTQLLSPTTIIAGFPQGGIRACQFPEVWNYTNLFKRTSKIQLRCTDTSMEPNNLRTALHGRMIFYGLPGGCPPTGSASALEPMAAMMNPYGGADRQGGCQPYMSQEQLAMERWRC